MAIGELHNELDFGNSMVPYLYVVLVAFESPLADDDPDVLTLHASKANTAINVHRIAAPFDDASVDVQHMFSLILRCGRFGCDGVAVPH